MTVSISRRDGRALPLAGDDVLGHRRLYSDGTLGDLIPDNGETAYFVQHYNGSCAAYWLDELEEIVD